MPSFYSHQCFQMFVVTIATLFLGQAANAQNVTTPATATATIARDTALQIKSEPESFNNIVDDVLSVTCSVNGTFNDDHTVLTLVLEKEDETSIAVLNQGEVHKSNAVRSNMEVEGNHDTTTGDRFLKLTVTNPGQEDAGNYSCALIYLNDMFHAHTDVVYTQVAFIENNDTTAVSGTLVNKIRDLAKIVEAQGKLIAEQNKTIEEQRHILQEQEKFSKKIDELMEKERNNSLKIQELAGNVGNNNNTTGPVVPSDVTNKISNLEKTVKDLEGVVSQQNNTIHTLEEQLKEQDKVSSKVDELVESEKNISLKLQALSDKVDNNNNNNTTGPVVPSDVTNKISNLEKTVKDLEGVVTQQNNTIHTLEERLKEQDKVSSKIDDLEARERNNSVKIQTLLNSDSVNTTAPKNNPLAKNVADLKDIVQEHEEVIAQQNNSIQNLGKDLKAQVSAMIEELENNTSLKLQALANQGSTASAFTAGYNIKDKYSVGDTLMFTEMITNQGNDYNPTNGVYTAPQLGLYVFHLVLTTGARDGNIQVDIKANSSVKATVFAWDKGITDQSSVSTVIKLSPGEQVKPVVRYASAGNVLYAEDHFSVFSGYLLRQL